MQRFSAQWNFRLSRASKFGTYREGILTTLGYVFWIVLSDRNLMWERILVEGLGTCWGWWWCCFEGFIHPVCFNILDFQVVQLRKSAKEFFGCHFLKTLLGSQWIRCNIIPSSWEQGFTSCCCSWTELTTHVTHAWLGSILGCLEMIQDFGLLVLLDAKKSLDLWEECTRRTLLKYQSSIVCLLIGFRGSYHSDLIYVMPQECLWCICNLRDAVFMCWVAMFYREFLRLVWIATIWS